MSNRTYRYFKGKALFTFGHGLSYTTFDYGKAKADKTVLRIGEGMVLTIPLKIQVKWLVTRLYKSTYAIQVIKKVPLKL